MPELGRHIEIRGTVQGVGFRPWVYRLARSLGVRGRVSNGPEGVAIEAFASAETLETFAARLHTEAPPAARIDAMSMRAIEHEPCSSFEIAASSHTGARRASIPPDLATCADCLAEIFDPSARRYRYAFTNCTNCGPRFTIAGDIPYDRAKTTMASFVMCAECQHEYEDPNDRRFHAQPIACPRCGPRLWLKGEGVVSGEDPLIEAARLLRAGAILAIKGLGGYHLACSAQNQAAVTTLRARKAREAKPLAVMVANLAVAETLADLEPVERAWLMRHERPIVLVQAKPGQLAPAVHPDTPRVGLMLAYTPLHHLLLAEAGEPLIMTSGNRSDEPIAFEDGDALDRLAGIADAFLGHDRAIETRADDSVMCVSAGRPRLWRRSRGFVPTPVAVATPFAQPVLAVGGHLKNTFCIGVGDQAYLGPHIGDLDTPAAYESLCRTIERFERFLGVQAEVVAHDLHPDYASTRYALARPAARRIAVQHHHAHIASLMAETKIDGPVLGLAFDGTGFGSDETAWGGEILRVDTKGAERLATFRPLLLAGGDRAIRQVWRIARAALRDCFGGDASLADLAVFSTDLNLSGVDQMLASGVGCQPAHGLGRYFDAVGALVLGRAEARFEGQVAMALEQAAGEQTGAEPYPYDIARDLQPWQIDLRPALRAIVADLRAGVSRALIARRFHSTVVAAVVAVVSSFDPLPVLGSGGCFQNATLSAGLRVAFGDRLVLHEQVPCNDGGLALGQAIVAGNLLQGELLLCV